ncbi:F-box/FBD/LRR-repeat protein At1g13570 [Daucus carota subsp. sativus]|uniref:F-box domain-containing protein n=1 Tax=Daucus carota subsp. sativus TaxID=79200 RepID=A0A165ABZ3_DAUCS|nr:PREDICTED: F-box/FBD/LRR-repeat protein At1g13570-like [Daucus carota subsp. sativus]XP_017244577.1 PREDICTED: F-box/FBD/LRR-repeat protein At1g13570-like [Daucus carota subsp. sativus]
MAESSMRKAGDIIKKDRISELPRNVQETILCFLPIEEAVRTSILSKNWRHCWTTMPHLIFDGGFYERMVDKLGYHSCTELMAYRCVSVINKTILLHRGPVLKFSLSIPGSECDAQIFHDYIDQWIPVLSSKGMKELMLEDLRLQEDTSYHFSSLDLTYLRLLSVWFPYKPKFGRFAYLTNLELVDATSHFGQDVFDCPVLEKLTLILCPGLYHSNFRAPNLSCLRQIYREINSEIPYVGLDNLKDYSFMLLQPGPLLAKTSNVVKYLGGLHKIEKFSIAREFVQYLADGGCPNRLSTLLCYLKTLYVSDINFTHLPEVSCLLCMIRSAPNLCKLYLLARYCDNCSEKDCYCEKDLEYYQIEDSEDCTTTCHLEVVTFSYFKGLKAELELVKFILAHSPLLKTMYIHRSESIKSDVALTMTEEILQYPRASTIAQIRHLKRLVEKKCVEIDDFDTESWYGYFE